MIKWIQENELNYKTMKNQEDMTRKFINSVEENSKYKILEFISQK